MKQLICPVSPEKVNENVVRLTALQVVLLIGIFIILPNPYIPIFLLFDFYLRAFTNVKSSPLSWISKKAVVLFSIQSILIDKAPKIFAARVGFLFSLLISALVLTGLLIPSVILAAVLMLFAFLECGLNFCAGCWVYSYIVLPFYNEN